MAQKSKISLEELSSENSEQISEWDRFAPVPSTEHPSVPALTASHETLLLAVGFAFPSS